MKNITDYPAEKYKAEPYQMIETGIFRTEDRYVTSLSFVQEPEYGEGTDSKMISQYPLEDVLDTFTVYISDFYDPENSAGRTLCHLEFASDDIADIRKLRSIIGKTVRTDSGELRIE